MSATTFQAKTAILIGTLDVGFLAAAILATWLALQGETRIDALGFICAGLNIIMYGSPLVAMVRTPKFCSLHPYLVFRYIFFSHCHDKKIEPLVGPIIKIWVNFFFLFFILLIGEEGFKLRPFFARNTL